MSTETDPGVHPPLVEGGSCFELLSERLEASPGVHAVEADFDAHTLTVRYEPSLVSPEALAPLAQEMSALVSQRVSGCARRSGPLACEACAERLGAAAAMAPFELSASPSRIALTRRDAPDGLALVRPLGQPRPWAEDDGSPQEVRGRVMATLAGLCLAGVIAGALLSHANLATAATVTWGVAALAGGWFALGSSLAALARFSFDINLLMIVAAAGAASIGYVFEAAVLMFLFSLSNTLEVFTMGRTRHALRALLQLRPARALVQRGGREVEVAAEDVRVGETVIVRPGEAIPVDGVVASGGSLVDQSSLTGESVPVTRQPGDPVFAGTMVQEGAMTVRTTRAAGDTTLARIVALVRDAQRQKSRTEELAHWVGRYYTIVVLIGAALMLIVPPWLMHAAFKPTFYRAMTLLVVASPCALVIATPATILSAIANAARHRILFKGGRHIEALGRVQAVAFDKTGTLTQGRFEVTDVEGVDGVAPDDALGWAAAAELRSQHPLARAVVRAAEARGIAVTPADRLVSHLGLGLEAMRGDEAIAVGKPELFDKLGLKPPAAALEQARAWSADGKTTVLVHRGGRWGVIAAADDLRAAATATVAALRQEGIRRMVLLSGDHPTTVNAIAQRCALDEHQGALLPEAKVEAVAELERRYGAVAMVGDGVNDAPALARATVGIAMGGIGSDAAMESADVVLMSDDLAALPYAFALARNARRVVAQNVTIASGVMLLLVTWVFLGAHTPFGALKLPVAVSGHEGSTVVVILNGLRLLGMRKA
ncbi:MAG TPA: heavy metal translocating P-type ATPase [Candidatus Eisenbacteria bacterium]|nr:heavy metal translocating P-type ATPase [Candidatus Eisenbacteria bacterium]